MKKNLFTLGLILFSILGYGQNQPNQTDPKAAFYTAFEELKNMLNGKEKLNYEKAVFITENAFYDNRFQFSQFQKVLDAHTRIIESVAQNAKEQFSEQYKSMKLYEQKMFDINALNWAIYKYISDTITINDLFFPTTKLPFNYSTSDPYGSSHWENTQVIHLFSSDSAKGNCYALATLFKLFSNRLNSDARLVVAPHHIYIQNRNAKGDFQNIDLATRTFPKDGSIQVLTYTTKTSIMNGMAQRQLNENEAVALNLIYLAKGYQHKFNNNTDDFLLKCAELSYKYDTLSLNALLLKAEVTENRLFQAMQKYKVENVKQAKANASIQIAVTNYENQLSNLYKCGYREIPNDIQHLIMSAIQGNKDGYITTDKTPNPFSEIGQKQRYASLSWGLFDEIHSDVDTVQYFHALLNTKTKKIIQFLPIDTNNFYKIDPVVFALNVDPLAHKFPWQSPYCAFDNSPIWKNDPTGASGEVTINKQSKTVTITSSLVMYGSGAKPELAKQTAQDIQDKWNAAKGKVTIEGVEYNVQFSITGVSNPNITAADISKNTDVKQNFVRVENKGYDGYNISEMDLGGNSGLFLVENIQGVGSTTEAHEFGHGYGEDHPAADANGVISTTGQPGIMYPRGTLVDAQYQYDPKAAQGDKGGTLNPEKRKVTQKDISNLGLDKLKFDKGGKANLGKTTNRYYK